MRSFFALVALVSIAAGAGLISSPDRAGAAFHLMRVYAVGGGAFGNSDIQWVELRQTDPANNLVATHDICFYDAAGAPQARFTFPAAVANGLDEASILVGSAEFDTEWAAGSPDVTFSAANTVDLDGAGPATPDHPMASPAGKVAFGTEIQLTPSLMCKTFAGGGTFSIIDSVAYGTGYTGVVDLGSVFGSDLPTAGTSAIRLQAPLCHPASIIAPCLPVDLPLDNSTDYALVDVNTAANNPRNNSNLSGPLSPPPDTDGDGVPDASDNCPNWPNPAPQTLPPWPVPAGDPDCDGFDTASENFYGTEPLEQCAANNGADNEPLPDKWPMDINDSQVVTTADVGFYIAPLNSIGPGLPYTTRLDLNIDNKITTADVGFFVAFLNKSCSP